MERMRFSDRVGATEPISILQLDDINYELRNSLWNYLLKLLYPGSKYTEHIKANRMICEYFFRLPVDELPVHLHRQPEWLRDFFFSRFDSGLFQWYDIYNLIEFITEHIDSIKGQFYQRRFIADINRILEREMSGYRFINGVLAPISSKEEIESINTSILLAKDSQLYGTKKHFETALDLIAKKPDPDYRNSIKESISAIESLAKQLTGENGGGLDKAFTKLDSKVHFHGAFKAGLLSLYGYTSDEDGIRHAILEESDIGFDEAKFMLVICSGLVNFIIQKANKHRLL